MKKKIQSRAMLVRGVSCRIWSFFFFFFNILLLQWGLESPNKVLRLLGFLGGVRVFWFFFFLVGFYYYEIISCLFFMGLFFFLVGLYFPSLVNLCRGQLLIFLSCKKEKERELEKIKVGNI
jgi:hypothetical protein